VVAVVLVLASAVGVAVLTGVYGVAGAGADASGVVGGVVGLAGLWLAWSGYRDGQEGGESSASLTSIADALAAAVKAQWLAEAARRELNDPYPLPVRWGPAPADLVADWDQVTLLATRGAGWPALSLPHRWAGSADELAGGDGDLAGVWARVPTGRLAVLGEPGSGKTTLLVRLVLDLLADGRRAGGDPVPLLVSVASWDPFRHDLYTWLAGRLAVDYPVLGRPGPPVMHGAGVRTMGRALLDHGLVMTVLDGLDEIPAVLRAAAVAGINQVVRPGTPLIVSSRTGAYRDAVRPAPGPEITLTGATGIELWPLEPGDVLAYLRSSAGGPAGVRRWDRIVEALTGDDPDGRGPALPAAADPDRVPPVRAIATPLMVALARTVYNPRPGEDLTALPDPGELLALPTGRAVEQHLFDGYIAAAYRPHPMCPNRWRADQARRWLGHLAYRLEHDHGGTPDLAWWRLHRPTTTGAAPTWLVIAAGIVVSVLFGPPALLLYGFVEPFRAAALIATSVAVTVGLAYAIVHTVTRRLDSALIAALAAGISGGLAAKLAASPVTQSYCGTAALIAGTAAGLALRPAALVAPRARVVVALVAGTCATEAAVYALDFGVAGSPGRRSGWSTG